MKKLRLLILLFAAANIMMITSCGDDDDEGDGGGSGNNNFTIDGVTYDLSDGYLVDYGSNAGYDSYDWDVILTSSGLVPNTSGATGEGDFVYLDLNTTSSTGLVAGTYDFADEREVNTIVDGEIGIDFVASTEEGEFSVVDGGTVTVSINGSVTTVSFDLDLVGGGTATGEFSGVLEEL